MPLFYKKFEMNCMIMCGIFSDWQTSKIKRMDWKGSKISKSNKMMDYLNSKQ
jgi:hypothetical protein